jgi:hypothetical protein
MGADFPEDVLSEIRGWDLALVMHTDISRPSARGEQRYLDASARGKESNAQILSTDELVTESGHVTQRLDFENCRRLFHSTYLTTMTQSL